MTKTEIESISEKTEIINEVKKIFQLVKSQKVLMESIMDHISHATTNYGNARYIILANQRLEHRRDEIYERFFDLIDKHEIKPKKKSSSEIKKELD